MVWLLMELADAQDYRNQRLGLPGSGRTSPGMTVTKYTPILTPLSGVLLDKMMLTTSY